MAAWVVCALCALIIVKPQEFILPLAELPLLYIAFVAALVAIVLDVVWRRVRPALAPHVPFLLAFYAWGFATTAVKRPDALVPLFTSTGILAAIFASIALGTASMAGLRAFALTFVAAAALVTTVAAVQSVRPYGCFIGEPDDWEGRGELSFDGRYCESTLDCRKDAPVANGNYRCERIGPLSTTTIGGRVRYRGSLADPNELSLTISIAMPFALALVDDRRRARARAEGPRRRLVSLPPLISDRFIQRAFTAARALPIDALILAIGYTVVLSRSRSGLIVFLTVLGIHAIRRIGAWGVVAGCVVAPPMILLGGRSGAEADSSADERTELLREALDFIKQTKGIGLGLNQFTGESSIGMTAHNAYLLAGAETGVVGLCLFGISMYLALKVPYAIWFGGHAIDPRVARMAPAVALALTGAAIGIFFLSWTYKDILYIALAASAALYGAVKAEVPSLRIRLSWKEAAIVSGAMIALLGVLHVVTRFRR